MDAAGSRDVETAPIFVDASGRRRRGLALAGWAGAAACTAYLAAFGITLSTNAGVVEVVGQTLEPSPYVDDEGDDPGDEGPEDLPADTVVAATPSHGTRTVEAVAVTTKAPAAGTTGRHAKADPVVAPARHAAHRTVHRDVAPPRVWVPVVPRHTAVGTGRHHTGGAVAGTPHSTPDTPPSGTSGGSSSSGGADPTTGTGSTGTGSTGTGSTGTGSTGSDAGRGTGSTGTGTGTTSTGTSGTGTPSTDTPSTGTTTPAPISTGILDGEV